MEVAVVVAGVGICVVVMVEAREVCAWWFLNSVGADDGVDAVMMLSGGKDTPNLSFHGWQTRARSSPPVYIIFLSLYSFFSKGINI